MKITRITMVLLLGILLVSGLACCPAPTPAPTPTPTPTPTEGALPILHVGDQWVWSYMVGETSYTMTEEVTGEETVDGRDCYVTDMSLDPTMILDLQEVACTVTSIKYWADKATYLSEAKMEMSYTCDGEAYTFTETYSYDPWVSLFPLEVGKEVEWERTTTQHLDGQTGYPMVTTEKYEVISTEDITVTAGTFSCFKIVMYDGEGSVTGTMWYSDTVKTIVKATDADGNTMMELLSYSVQ